MVRSPALGSESTQRDLILAAVENYDWEPMRAFVESLEATGFDGEVRFFVWNVTAETERTLREHGIAITRPRRLRFRFRGALWHPYNWKTNRLRWHSQPFYGRLVRGLAALTPSADARRRASPGRSRTSPSPASSGTSTTSRSTSATTGT